MMNKAITKKDLEKNLLSTGCAFRWSYPVIKYDRAQIRTCCSVGTNESISQEQLENAKSNLFLNSTYVIVRRIEMLKGLKHSDCATCWKLEKGGIKSQRQQTIPLNQYLHQKLNFLNESELSDLAFQNLAIATKPQTLEIQLDNICELACIYCNADYSSSWANKTGKTFSIPESKHLLNFQNEFWNWYETIMHELVEICIVGGEPLNSPYLFEVLDKIQLFHDKNSQKMRRPITLILTSNFNARPEIFSKFLAKLDTLKDHFNLSINASIEAIGVQAEFIRVGLKWDRFNQNIQTFLKFHAKVQTSKSTKRFNFSILSSQNVFSLTCLPEFLSWVMELEDKFNLPIKINQNIVSYPAHFSIQSVLSSSHAHFCYEGIELIQRYKEMQQGKQAGNQDLSRWDNYANFLSSIALDLENGTPDIVSQKMLGEWIQCLTPERKKIFSEYFSHFSY